MGSLAVEFRYLAIMKKINVMIPEEEQIERPDVTRVRHIIEDTFSLHAGPIVRELIPGAYSKWLERGHLRVSSLRKYVHLLADYLPDPEQKQEFINEATMCIVTRTLSDRYAGF